MHRCDAYSQDRPKVIADPSLFLLREVSFLTLKLPLTKTNAKTDTPMSTVTATVHGPERRRRYIFQRVWKKEKGFVTKIIPKRKRVDVTVEGGVGKKRIRAVVISSLSRIGLGRACHSVYQAPNCVIHTRTFLSTLTRTLSDPTVIFRGEMIGMAQLPLSPISKNPETLSGCNVLKMLNSI